MRLIKIGMASLDTTVGAVQSNLQKMLAAARIMIAHRAMVGVFNEQTIPGYPHEDLTQWRSFMDQQWQALCEFAQLTKVMQTERPEQDPTVFVVGLTVEWNGHPKNCLAIVCAGEILGIVPKEKLPTYNVFYDGRVYSPGIPGHVADEAGVPFGDLLFEFSFGIMGVEVCEDIWSPDGPMRRRSYSGAELIVNGSSSPFRAGVLATRREMITTRAGDNQVTIVYVNQVGGQDSLVFDGGAFVCQNGRILFETPRWKKDHVSFQVVDLDRTARLRRENTTWRNDCTEFLRGEKLVTVIDAEAMLRAKGQRGPRPTYLPSADMPYPTPTSKSFFIPEEVPLKSRREEYFDDLIAAMKLALDGYFTKTGAFDRIGVALSGGKDSWLTVYIAALYALERFAHLPTAEKMAAVHDFIHVFSFPTRFNSAETQSITRRTASAFNLHLVEQSIEDAFARECEAACELLEWPTGGEHLPKLVRQNIQARIRGERMWNWANGARGMWLQTSNMSEKAVGYTTIGGDMMGAYSLIANLPKTVVIALIAYLGEKHAQDPVGKIIRDLLATRASAELDENQADEDDLMPFPVLDACFNLFAGEKMSPVEMHCVLRQMWSDDELRALAPSYEKGMLKAWVKKFCRSFLGSIFKWVQTPQAVHLGTLDLDRERALQLPVVQSREWLELEKLDELPD